MEVRFSAAEVMSTATRPWLDSSSLEEVEEVEELSWMTRVLIVRGTWPYLRDGE